MDQSSALSFAGKLRRIDHNTILKAVLLGKSCAQSRSECIMDDFLALNPDLGAIKRSRVLARILLAV